MVASPSGPGKDEAGRVCMVGAKAIQEAMDLWDADGDEVVRLIGGIWAPFFATPRTRAARQAR